MKIKNVIIATFSVALLASCGGTDVCSCAEMGMEMMEEIAAAEGDAAKIAEINESYKSDQEACTEAAAERAKEIEAMSDEERMTALQEDMEEAAGCAAN